MPSVLTRLRRLRSTSAYAAGQGGAVPDDEVGAGSALRRGQRRVHVHRGRELDHVVVGVRPGGAAHLDEQLLRAEGDRVEAAADGALRSKTVSEALGRPRLARRALQIVGGRLPPVATADDRYAGAAVSSRSARPPARPSNSPTSIVAAAARRDGARATPSQDGVRRPDGRATTAPAAAARKFAPQQLGSRPPRPRRPRRRLPPPRGARHPRRPLRVVWRSGDRHVLRAVGAAAAGRHAVGRGLRDPAGVGRRARPLRRRRPVGGLRRERAQPAVPRPSRAARRARRTRDVRADPRAAGDERVVGRDGAVHARVVAAPGLRRGQLRPADHAAARPDGGAQPGDGAGGRPRHGLPRHPVRARGAARAPPWPKLTMVLARSRARCARCAPRKPTATASARRRSRR